LRYCHLEREVGKTYLRSFKGNGRGKFAGLR